jgi:hypothetical protein
MRNPFRRKNFTDDQLIEAWGRGEVFLKLNGPTPEEQAKLLAALNQSSAAVEPPPAPAVEVARRGAQPAQEARPAGFPPDECRCGGHIGWIDRGDSYEGSCHGPCKMPHFRSKQREPRSIAEFAETIDLLQQENEALHRENKRLRSELNQAVAQRDIVTEIHAADIEAARIAAAGLEAFRIEGSSYPHSSAEALHRENKRLRSELNQAVAQRDIARAQRDEARATSGRMSP